MKKFLKRFFIIVLVLLALYLIYSLIVTKVYFDIYTAMKEKVENEDSFYAKKISNEEDYIIEFEVIIKDNVFIKKISRINEHDNECMSIKLWQKYLPHKTDDEDGKGYIFAENGSNKNLQELEYDPTAIEPENKMYRYNLLSSMIMGEGIKESFFSYNEMTEYTYSKMLKDVLKCPTLLYITTYNGEECYAIKQFCIFNMGNLLFVGDANYFEMLTSTYVQYVSKDTKLPVGNSSNGKLLLDESNCEYFTKEVTGEDIKLPDLSEYEKIKN